MQSNTIEIPYQIFSDREELPLADRRLLEKAQEASASAYAPYSGFCVGAAALLDNGTVVLGNNQENVSYPEGLCAERVALFSAMAQHPKEQIKTLAVYANPMGRERNNYVTPCGACRQVLMEYEQRSKHDIRILCAGTAGEILVVESAKCLLPFNFNM